MFLTPFTFFTFITASYSLIACFTICVRATSDTASLAGLENSGLTMVFSLTNGFLPFFLPSFTLMESKTI